MERKSCPWCMEPLHGDDDVCPRCGQKASAYLPSPQHLPPGTMLLERYELGGVIGEGGFGITYLAYDHHLERRVAIKEYYPIDRAVRIGAVSPELTPLGGAAGDVFERGRQRFLKEAHIMARMQKQAAIVSVYDHFEANHTAYIVMEHVKGVTLKQIVEKEGPIAPERLLTLMEPILRTLSAMHEDGLLHRDISPDNLMLEHDELRLLDFGCARECDEGQETLTIALKHSYAPIEQYRPKGQGPWSDVYALCATMYFCLTGVEPPPPLDRVPKDTLTPPSQLGVHLTKRQEQAILQGLRVQARRRFPTVEAFRQALLEQDAQPAPSPRETQRMPSPTPPPRRVFPRKGIIAGVACALAAALVLCLLLPRISLPQGETFAEQRMFDHAEKLPAGVYGRDTLAQLMADDSVPSIVLRDGVLMDLNETDNSIFELTKPVLVEKDARLCANLLSIPESGRLVVRGELDCRGLIELKGSGVRLSVTGVFSQYTRELAVILMEENGNAEMESWLAAAMHSRMVLLPSAEEAHAVSDTWSLNEGLRLYDALVLSADLTVSGREEITGKTIFIPEGVKVASADIQSGLRLENCVLVNEGTLSCGLTAEHTAIINRGTLSCLADDGAVLSLSLKEGATLVNRGRCLLTGDSLLATGAHLTNLADCSVHNLQVDGGSVANLAGMELIADAESDPSGVSVSSGSLMYNGGVLHFPRASRLFNYGWISNDGHMLLDEDTSGYFGAVENRHGQFTVQDHTQLNFGSVFGPGIVDGEGAASIAHFSTPAFDLFPEQPVTVTSEAELREAMRGGDTILLSGNVTLTEPLEVTSPLYVTGTLAAGPDAPITVEQAPLILWVGSLEAHSLCLNDDSSLCLAYGGSLTVDAGGEMRLNHSICCGSGIFVMQSGARLTLSASCFAPESLDPLTLDGAEITVTRSFLTWPRQLRLAANDLTINAASSALVFPGPTALTDSRLRLETYSRMFFAGTEARLERCAVDVSESCEWLTRLAELTLTDGTELTNDGLVDIMGVQDIRGLLTVDGTVVNRGEMHLWTERQIASPIVNAGSLLLKRIDGVDQTEVEGSAPVIME